MTGFSTKQHISFTNWFPQGRECRESPVIHLWKFYRSNTWPKMGQVESGLLSAIQQTLQGMLLSFLELNFLHLQHMIIVINHIKSENCLGGMLLTKIKPASSRQYTNMLSVRLPWLWFIINVYLDLVLL